MSHTTGAAWPVARLSRLFEVRGGTTPAADEINWNGPVPWVTPVDLRPVHGGYVSESSRTLSDAGATSAGLVPAPEGSIVLSCRAPVGYVAISTLPVTTNQGCKTLVATTDVDARYFRYQLEVFRDALEVRGRGSTFVEVSSQTVADFPVAVPPFDTQRRIADMLDAETARIDTLIEKNERVLDLLAIREARVLEDEIYGAVARPVGIHYLATYVNGFPFKPDDRSDEGTPIIRIAQLLGDTRQQDYYAGTPDPYCHIDSGDLIFSWSATLAAKIWDGGPAFLNQHLFKVEPHEGIDRYWLLHALNAAVPRMKSMTHGSTMTHITRPMMTKVRVPKPPLDEQRRIAASVRVQFERIAALRMTIDRQQELLRLRRQALITAAVTGQIEV